MDTDQKKVKIMNCHDDLAISAAYHAMQKVLQDRQNSDRSELESAPASIQIKDGLALYKQTNSPFFWCRISLPQKGMKEERRSTKERTVNEATQAALIIQSEVLAQFEAGTLKTKTVHTWSKVCAEVRDELQAIADEKIEKGNDKPTEADYVSHIEKRYRKHEKFYNLKISEVQYAELHELSRHEKFKGLSKTQATTLKTTLKRIYEYALRKRYITQDQFPKLPDFNWVAGKETPIFEAKDLDLILTNFVGFFETSRNFKTRLVRAQFPMYFAVLSSCGLRPGKEPLGVKWSDIKHNRLKYGDRSITAYYVDVRRGKMSRRTEDGKPKREEYSREIIMYPETAIALEELYFVRFGERKTIEQIADEGRNEPLFSTHDGKNPAFDDTFDQYMKYLKKQISKRYTLYSVRHEFINNELDKGIPVRDVADQCGNGPETINKYYKKFKAMRRVTRLLSREELAHFNPDLLERDSQTAHKN